MSLRFKTGRVNVSSVRVKAALDNPKTSAIVYAHMLIIQGLAVTIFTAQVKHSHGVTPPPYATKFKIAKMASKAAGWKLTNDDPAAFWIEFGAYIHHPTHPMILRYAPIRRAVSIVS